MYCPHCGSPAVVRTSNRLSPLVRESQMMCRNALCGHTFVALTSIERTLSPSATPNPDIKLPMSEQAESRRRRQEDAAKQAAMDSDDDARLDRDAGKVRTA
jgi:hypothetical protein